MFDEIASRVKELVEELNPQVITPELMALAVLNLPGVMTRFEDAGVEIDSIMESLRSFMDEIPQSTGDAKPVFANVVHQVMTEAHRLDRRAMAEDGDVSPYSLLAAIASLDPQDHYAAFVLRGIKADIDAILDEDFQSNPLDHTREQDDPWANLPATDRKVLQAFCTDLTEQAVQGKMKAIIGRDAILEKVSETVARLRKRNVLLVGDTGVGKTAIAEGLAVSIANGTAPAILSGHRVLALNVASLSAGLQYRGEFESRINALIGTLGKIPHVLWIDEMHSVVTNGSGGPTMDLTQLLKPALSAGIITVVGATTPEEYRKHIEKDAAFAGRFSIVRVAQPSQEETLAILKGIREQYETFHNVKFEDEALQAAVALSGRYITSRQWPDKAIDVIDMAAARHKVGGKSLVTAACIREQVERMTGIPLQEQEDDTIRLAGLLDRMKATVINQDQASEILSDAVIVSKAGMNTSTKPLTSVLMTGPTGTGKTLMAKTLADQLGLPLVRFDMSEYMERHTVSKLIGSPPGYVGYGDGGAGSGVLINTLDQSPACVLLFDEVEKAHPDVLNILLQLLDNGEVSSSSGRTASARQAYVLLTSNVGAKEAGRRSVGFIGSDTGAVEKAMEMAFSPELRNRMDAIVTFKPLSREGMILITRKELDAVIGKMSERGITLTVDDAVIDHFATVGYDPAMGARPLGRVIKNHLISPLSREIVFGKLKNGGSVQVVMDEGKVTFSYGDSTPV